jgi:hypothetical protein
MGGLQKRLGTSEYSHMYFDQQSLLTRLDDTVVFEDVMVCD